MKFGLRFFLSGVFILGLCFHTIVSAQNYDYLAAVKSDGRWGFIDSAGKVVIPFEYQEASGFSEGIACVKLMENRWGYIDQHDKWVLKPIFIEAFSFHNNRALVKMYEGHDKTYFKAYITKDGNADILLAPTETGYDFRNGFVRILSADVNGIAYGFKDTFDKWHILPHYDESTDFHEAHAAVRLGTKWGIIDTAGVYTIFPDYDDTETFYDGLAYLKKGKTVSFIRKDRSVAFSTDKYEEVMRFFSEGLVAFKEGGKMGFLDKKGKVTIKPHVGGEILGSFIDGMAMFAENNNGALKFGFIDKKGKVVIPAQFENVSPFINGRAVAQLGGKYGFINKKGEWVVKPQYEAANPYTMTY